MASIGIALFAGPVREEVSTVKRMFALLLVLLLCLPALAETWVYDAAEDVLEIAYELLEDGTAKITYIGCMSDELIIPEELDGHTVTALAPEACSGMMITLVIPNSLTEVGDGLSRYTPWLRKIVIEPDHPTLAIRDGALFDKVKRRLICMQDKQDTSYRIPGDTLAIGAYAFSGLSDLTAVDLPQGLVEIASGAFEYCEGLRSVVLPDSVTTIGDNPFHGCRSLCELVVSPDHPALEMVDGALYGREDQRLICLLPGLARSSIEVRPGTRRIGARAFYELGELSFVSLPEGLTDIGADAFSNCAGLTSIDLPDSLTSLDEGAFFSCGVLSIDIPGGVKTIGRHAFESCWQLTSAVLQEGLTEIPAEMFQHCGELYSVWMPQSVKSIGDHAFCECDALAEIELPKGLISVGDGAFDSCGLCSISIPASLTGIGSYLFRRCDRLSSVSLPEGLTSIGEGMFSGCLRLKAIELPDTLTDIGDDAFSSSGLTSIDLPEGVCSLGSGALCGCSDLIRAALPASLIEVGYDPFYDCTSLEEVVVSPENPILSAVDGVLYDAAGGRLISCFALPADGCCRVPPSVRVIGAYAFYGRAIKGIELPEGLTVIEERAFQNTHLRRVVVPEGTVRIAALAFADCEDLAEVELPASVAEIDDEAFVVHNFDLLVPNPRMVITVPAGSYAERYCAEKELAYVAK